MDAAKYFKIEGRPNKVFESAGKKQYIKYDRSSFGLFLFFHIEIEERGRFYAKCTKATILFSRQHVLHFY